MLADTLHLALLPSEEGENIIQTMISFNHMPVGVTGNHVADGGQQISDVLRPFIVDFKAFRRIAGNIQTGSFGDREVEFLEAVLSAWRNFPPADGERDLFIAGMRERIEVIRISPEVALNMTAQIAAL